MVSGAGWGWRLGGVSEEYLPAAARRLVLIDWDTAGLGPPERDLALIATGGADLGRYRQATGRQLHPAILTFYRLRWYLDDGLASAIRLFRNRHRDTPDTPRWARRPATPARPAPPMARPA